jgi:NAD+ kinase
VPLPPPRSLVIFHHPKLTESELLAEEIAEYLCAHGLKAEASSIDDEAKRAQAGEADMLVALGGDGTMLRVGRTGAFNGQPVLGINLGRLGFLVEVQPDEWKAALHRVLDGDYRIEERMMLHASHCQNGAEMRSYEALNEVVVGRGVVFRPVRLQTFINSEPLTTYVADGLIASTPTGSTAYALAAGGPILPPEGRNILLVPISPHISLDRSIVLPPESHVEIFVRTEHEAVFSIDGQTSKPIQDRDSLRVRISKNIARFVRLQPPMQFYQSLADRMALNPTADKAK